MLVRRHLHPQFQDDVCIVFDVRSFHAVLLIILPFIRRIAKSQPTSKKWASTLSFAEEQMDTTLFISRYPVLYENILNIILEFMIFNPGIIYDYWSHQLDLASQRMRDVEYLQYCHHLQRGMRGIRILYDNHHDQKDLHVYRIKRRLIMVEFRPRGWFRRILEWFRRTRRLAFPTPM